MHLCSAPFLLVLANNVDPGTHTDNQCVRFSVTMNGRFAVAATPRHPGFPRASIEGETTARRRRPRSRPVWASGTLLICSRWATGRSRSRVVTGSRVDPLQEVIGVASDRDEVIAGLVVEAEPSQNQGVAPLQGRDRGRVPGVPPRITSALSKRRGEHVFFGLADWGPRGSASEALSRRTSRGYGRHEPDEATVQAACNWRKERGRRPKPPPSTAREG